MKPEIIAYYDRLAPAYDASRFSNSYGRFIDERERALLRAWLPADPKHTLELGCGTGRLSAFAGVATDASLASLNIAGARNPGTRFIAADAERLPFATSSFDAVFALHLLMHLDVEAIRTIFLNAFRVLRPGGVFVADVVSKARREFTGGHKAQEAWHAQTAMTKQEFDDMGRAAGFKPLRATGLLLLPVHRLPHALRMPLARVDTWLGQRLPSLSSYLIAGFEKP